MAVIPPGTRWREVPCWAIAIVAALLGAVAAGAALTLSHGTPHG